MKKIYVLNLKNRAFPSRVFTMLFIAFIALFNVAKAENIISSGTTLKVTAGTVLVSSEGLTIKSGATLDNAGTVILKKNLANQNASANPLGSGTVVLSGTVAQTISGMNTIQNLTVNNAAGIINGGETRVNGVLSLTSGLVTLGINNFLLGSSATVVGGSATAMLVPTSTGEVRKTFAGIGTFTFPVGDNNAPAEYSPVTLAFTAGTFGSGNYAGVKLVNAIYPGSPAVNYIKRYWDVSQSGITGFSCNSTFQYVVADVVGPENTINCLRITPSTVTYFSAANTVLHQLTANAATTFGTFTGNQVLANKTLNLTVLLQGLYNGAGTMRKAQNAGGDQFPGTTADQIRVELHNSAAYSSLAYTLNNINVSTAGASSVTVPGIFSGSYYVTIRHRNTVETTTASPIAFTSSPIAYNFTNLATKAYGSNMKLMSGGFWAFFAGDVGQDGLVDATDLISVDNANFAFATGYIPEDCDGNGLVDSSDMILVDNNAKDFVSAITP